MDHDHKYGVPLLALSEPVNLRIADVPDYATSASRATKSRSDAASNTPLMPNTVDLDCRDSRGYIPLMVAADRGHDDVVAQLLIQADISPNTASAEGYTPLICAARSGCTASVRLLAARADVDLNFQAPGGLTALLWAIKMGHEVVVQILLSHADIDVNTGVHAGWTPFLAAVTYNNEGMVKLLLTHRSLDVNCKNAKGRNALAIAAMFGHEAMVKLLVTCPGIDLNSKAKNGHTPLSQAAYGWLDDMGYWESVKNARLPKHEATVKRLLTRTDIDIGCIDEEGNNLLSRVRRYAQEISEPRLEGVIALLRAAMDERSSANCED